MREAVVQVQNLFFVLLRYSPFSPQVTGLMFHTIHRPGTKVEGVLVMLILFTDIALVKEISRLFPYLRLLNMYSNIGLFFSFDKLRIWNYKDLYCEWCVPLHAVKVLRSGGSAPVVFKPCSVRRCVASFTLQERLSEFSLKLSLDSIPARMSHIPIEFHWYRVGSRELLQKWFGVWRNVWHDLGLRAHRDSEVKQIWIDVLNTWGNTRKIFPPLHFTVLVGLPFCHYRLLSLINEYDDHSVSINWPHVPCCTLASFRINFQASVSLSIFLQPLASIYFQITYIPKTTLYWLYNGIFHSVMFLNTFFTVPSSYDDQQRMKNFEEVSKERHISAVPGLKYK